MEPLKIGKEGRIEGKNWGTWGGKKEVTGPPLLWQIG